MASSSTSRLTLALGWHLAVGRICRAVCNTSMLMSVLECMAGISINRLILVLASPDHLLSNARAYMDQKALMIGQYFLG